MGLVLLAIFLGFLFLFFLLFGFLIYPIWVLVHCANSGHSTRAKTIWIIVMILCWPLGAFIYGFFASRKKVFQVFVIVYFALTAALVGTLVWLLSWLVTESQQTFKGALSTLNHMNVAQLTDAQKSKLNRDLEILLSEFNNERISYKQLKSFRLIEAWEEISNDHLIDANEYRRWTIFFENRDDFHDDFPRESHDNFNDSQNAEIKPET